MDDLINDTEKKNWNLNWNWSNIYIGTMLLINNIIIVSVIFYADSKLNDIDDIGSSIRHYFDNYTLHVSFK